MNELHEALSAWDAQMARIRPVTMFHAAVGRRRAFLSSNDARAYERGWELYPEPLPDSEQGPMRDGWRDAQHQVAEGIRELVTWSRPARHVWRLTNKALRGTVQPSDQATQRSR